MFIEDETINTSVGMFDPDIESDFLDALWDDDFFKPSVRKESGEAANK